MKYKLFVKFSYYLKGKTALPKLTKKELKLLCITQKQVTEDFLFNFLDMEL